MSSRELAHNGLGRGAGDCKEVPLSSAAALGVGGLCASEKTPGQPVPSLASATAKTQSVIEGLQARLGGEATNRPHKQAPPVSPTRRKNMVEVVEEETEEDLERQLQTYFATTIHTRPAPGVANPSSRQFHESLRSRVIEGVVHRILAEWARHDQELPGGARLGNEIMERLIQRVLEQFQELAAA